MGPEALFSGCPSVCACMRLHMPRWRHSLTGLPQLSCSCFLCRVNQLFRIFGPRMCEWSGCKLLNKIYVSNVILTMWLLCHWLLLNWFTTVVMCNWMMLFLCKDVLLNVLKNWVCLACDITDVFVSDERFGWRQLRVSCHRRHAVSYWTWRSTTRVLIRKLTSYLSLEWQCNKHSLEVFWEVSFQHTAETCSCCAVATIMTVASALTFCIYWQSAK